MSSRSSLLSPAALLLCALTTSSPDLIAQQRTAFTFHVYVDPVYGDDIRADEQNPDQTGGGFKGVPLQGHPSLGFEGNLQHAPYSFRTVTNALSWFTGTFSSFQGLPWTHPTNGARIDYVVIHCLPGLYGPLLEPGTEEIDPLSGLPWNGEIFPIDVPPRVSIQGASALNTIFDARCREEGIGPTNIFTFGRGFATPPPLEGWEFSFLDSVTIRGAESEGEDEMGAGVKMQHESPVRATVSNCFIYNNTVGIALIKVSGLPGSERFVHYPRIVNNTFAWNEVGIYNGSRIAGMGSTGVNEPIVLNNVFDTATPATSGPGPHLPLPTFSYVAKTVGVAAFQGMNFDDMVVVSKQGCSMQPVNPNAFESARANTGAAPTGWQPTLARNGGGTVTPPIVDLTPFTGPAGRGELYINDIFRNDPTLPPSAVNASQHDFRLAPMAHRSGAGYTEVNPLVNKGIDFGKGPVPTGVITMRTVPADPAEPSPVVLTRPPGLPLPALPTGPEDVARLDAWDYDGEGFGNPRVAQRSFIVPPSPCLGVIDLGADEMGEVIISGYVDSTTCFSKPHAGVAPNTAGLHQRDRLFFFNLGPWNWLRPQFNVTIDWKKTQTPRTNTRSEWYAQVTPATNPYDASGTSNYTDGAFEASLASTRQLLVNSPPAAPFPFPKFMRNLVCDLAPHLYHDIDPVFTMPENWLIHYAEFEFSHSSHPTPIKDVFKANPWYNQADPLGSAAGNDNRRLYYEQVFLRSGIVSPPATVVAGDIPPPPFQGRSFLFENSFHPIAIWDFEAPFNFQYGVDHRGWGDYGTGGELVPYVLGNQLHGLRVNCELVEPDELDWASLGVFENNLQSFLVVQDAASGNAPNLPLEDLGGGGEEMSAATSSATSTPRKRLATSILVETHARAIAEAFREIARQWK